MTTANAAPPVPGRTSGAVRSADSMLKAGNLERAILSSARFSSIATDSQGIIQIFNVGAELMLGYRSGEVVNAVTPVVLFDPQELVTRATALSAELGVTVAPGLDSLVAKASRGFEDVFELTYVRKDASRFPGVVSVTALRDEEDQVIGFLLIGTDNSARRLVEDERLKLDQRLRDQHFYTRSLIESNIDALMTTDPRGIITDVNKQAEALTGRTRDELIGAPFRDCFAEPQRADAGIGRVLNEGQVTNYELTARARDGTLTPVSFNATTLHDRDRKLQGVFVAARDVTERKRFEQMLQQQNADLANASRMKSAFIANMSHELRTPLNAILGFSEVLRDGLIGDLTDQQREFVGDIFSSGRHLLSLINDILDLSKVEAGKMVLDAEPVDVSSMLANSLTIIREKAAARHIRLRLETADDLGLMQADTRKVKQIVYNLLSNAVRFTAEGGSVILRARRVPRAEVGRLRTGWPGRILPLAEGNDESFLEISVTDDGIGIPAEELHRLFEPFSQLSTGPSHEGAGTGLGLGLVKLLAELHGGTVGVESAAGEGSCFTVWLPALVPDPARNTPARGTRAERVQPSATSRVALVVDADAGSAELIRVQLEAEGFSVVHATSPEAALELAAAQTFSLITMDVWLSGADRSDFLSRITQIESVKGTPIVIISIAADREKCIALGAAAVLEKPVLRQTLYETLMELGLFPTLDGSTLKVLVVDDDPEAVELIADRLAGLAGTVLRASGGLEAIEITRKELPDLILLDVFMPVVNGFDVVDALHEQPETAQIPIVVVTAKRITAEDRAKLRGRVSTILDKVEIDRDRFTLEVRRAVSRRARAA